MDGVMQCIYYASEPICRLLHTINTVSSMHVANVSRRDYRHDGYRI